MADVQIIPTKRRIVALDWDGDDLVSGDYRWAPDGTTNNPRPIRRHIPEPFDQTITFGAFRVVYVERGTKALLYQGDDLIRELNRSYYHASDFDYPIALGALPNGRNIVVHCPDQYNTLQIDDAATGERLTTGSRKPVDIFHSRLAISPDGRHLLSAGWYWQPEGVAEVFDLTAALESAEHLDGDGVTGLMSSVEDEVWSACWLDADRLAVSSGEVEESGQFGVWSLDADDWTFRSEVAFPIGILRPVGGKLLCLYGHPRLIDPDTGTVLLEWPEVDAGRRAGSYGVTHYPTPITAIHPDGDRVAIAQPDGIAVLHL
ncbi:MAG TPA: hypothetical protein VGJ28_17125 [Micromonosporaceae bacterium]